MLLLSSELGFVFGVDKKLGVLIEKAEVIGASYFSCGRWLDGDTKRTEFRSR